MSKVLVAVMAVALVVVGTAPAGGQQAESSVTTKQLSKRVKKLERRVRALALLQRRQDVATDVHDLPMQSLGNGQYRGEVGCARGVPVGGGSRFPTSGSASDHPIDSYPTFRGWYAFAVSSGGTPTVFVVCARVG